LHEAEYMLFLLAVVLMSLFVNIISSYIHDRLRSASGLKSVSTDVIISNNGPIYGYSQIGVLSKFSDLWPIYCYQIDVLFRVKICMCFYLVTWWMWVKFVHHLHCILGLGFGLG